MKFDGQSGYEHLFHFVIPKSSQEHPEWMVRAINHPDRNAVQSLAFAWGDIESVRPAQARPYVVLNDVEEPVSDKVVSAFDKCDIQMMRWSKREEALQELVA